MYIMSSILDILVSSTVNSVAFERSIYWPLKLSATTRFGIIPRLFAILIQYITQRGFVFL